MAATKQAQTQTIKGLGLSISDQNYLRKSPTDFTLREAIFISNNTVKNKAKISQAEGLRLGKIELTTDLLKQNKQAKELIENYLQPFVDKKGIALDSFLDSSFEDFAKTEVFDIFQDITKTNDIKYANDFGTRVNKLSQVTKAYNDIVKGLESKILGSDVASIFSDMGKQLKEETHPNVLPFNKIDKINNYFDRVNFIQAQNALDMRNMKSSFMGNANQKNINTYAKLLQANFQLAAGKDLVSLLAIAGMRNAEALSLELFDDEADITLEKDPVTGKEIGGDPTDSKRNLERSTFRKFVDKDGVERYHLYVPKQVTKTPQPLDYTVGNKLGKLLETRAAIAQQLGSRQLFALPTLDYFTAQAEYDLGNISKTDFQKKVKSLKSPIEGAFSYGIIGKNGNIIESKSKSETLITRMFTTLFGWDKDSKSYTQPIPRIGYNADLADTVGVIKAHGLRKFMATKSDDFIKFVGGSLDDQQNRNFIISFLQGRVGELDPSILQATTYVVKEPYKTRQQVGNYLDDFLDYVLKESGDGSFAAHINDMTQGATAQRIGSMSNKGVGSLVGFQGGKQKATYFDSNKSQRKLPGITATVTDVPETSVETVSEVEKVKAPTEVDREIEITKGLNKLEKEGNVDISEEYYKARKSNKQRAAEIEKAIFNNVQAQQQQAQVVGQTQAVQQTKPTTPTKKFISEGVYPEVITEAPTTAAEPAKPPKSKGFISSLGKFGKFLPVVGAGAGLMLAEDALAKDPSEFLLSDDEDIEDAKRRQRIRAGLGVLEGVSPIPLDLSILNLANPIIPGEEYDFKFKTLGEAFAPTAEERANEIDNQMNNLFQKGETDAI